MPAYTQHHEQHHDILAAITLCPRCLSLPLQIREVQPRWDLARVDFIYECTACCIEIRESIAKH